MIRGKEKFLTQIYMGTDFLIVQASFFLAWFFRFEVFLKEPIGHLSFSQYWFWSSIYGLIFIMTAYVGTLYIPKRKSKFATELAKLLQAHVISAFILLSILFVVKSINVSRLFLLALFLISVVMTVFYRYLVKQSLRHLRKKGYNKQFVVIIGAGDLGEKYFRNLENHPEFGLEVVGFLDDFRKGQVNNKPILGQIDDIEQLFNKKIIDEVVIALPLSAHTKYRKIILKCEKAGVRVSIIPDFYPILPATPHFQILGELPIINVRDVPLDEASNKVMKRIFDILFSLMAIILTLPIMIVIAIVTKLTSPGPVLFKQERVGLNRRTFYMYKFRSMKVATDRSSDVQWTVENDPRRTRFGSFIRRTSLDELPQFFNVLKGDMSIVGPRPERPFFVDQFKEEIPKYMVKHQVRPGITGWAQVSGLRGDTSISDRIAHDIFYIEHWTLLFDIKIILKTITNGFVNRNAY